MAKITVDEWLAALEAAEAKADANGITAEEMALAAGRHVKWVYENLRRAIHAGTMECAGFRAGTTIAGHRKTVPVYRRVKPKARS